MEKQTFEEQKLQPLNVLTWEGREQKTEKVKEKEQQYERRQECERDRWTGSFHLNIITIPIIHVSSVHRGIS